MTSSSGTAGNRVAGLASLVLAGALAVVGVSPIAVWVLGVIAWLAAMASLDRGLQSPGA